MLFSGHGMGYGMDAARLSLLLCTLAAVPGGDLVNAASHQRRWVPEQTEQDFFFWNSVTGEMQWEDPGDVPYEDEGGSPYWRGPKGELLRDDKAWLRYVWVELHSEELGRRYYYNQETRESTWERPADLAWRRVRLQGFAAT